MAQKMDRSHLAVHTKQIRNIIDIISVTIANSSQSSQSSYHVEFLVCEADISGDFAEVTIP